MAKVLRFNMEVLDSVTAKTGFEGDLPVGKPITTVIAERTNEAGETDVYFGVNVKAEGEESISGMFSFGALKAQYPDWKDYISEDGEWNDNVLIGRTGRDIILQVV